MCTIVCDASKFMYICNLFVFDKLVKLLVLHCAFCDTQCHWIFPVFRLKPPLPGCQNVSFVVYVVHSEHRNCTLCGIVWRRRSTTLVIPVVVLVYCCDIHSNLTNDGWIFTK